MPRTGGWRREGTRSRFRYLDGRGNRITDEDKLERIRSLVIPPAWTDVWISSRATAKLQATGVDGAGRRQYIYHPDFRAQQEHAKYDRLIRFAEHVPDLRTEIARHFEADALDRERVSAIATRLINRAWFRVGSERYARESQTFGITTLRKGHVQVRDRRVAFHFRGKHRADVRTQLVDAELAGVVNELLELRGGPRLFRYEWNGGLCNLTGAKLNEYIREYLVSPAVVEQYLDGRTIEDCRPSHLRVVGARDVGLDQEEQALLSLLRSWRIRQARMAA